jgi:hypothetical protein
MGYRNYIGVMPKREYNKIKSLTTQGVYDFYQLKSEFEDEEPYKGVYTFGKELYEFGKYVDFNPPKGSAKPFFKKKETQKRWDEENEFAIVTKEFLAYVIDTYKERVKKYYNEMMLPFFGKRDSILDRENPTSFLNSVTRECVFDGDKETKYKFDFSKITDEEQTALFEIIEHIRSMRTEWTVLTPFDLERGDEITISWKYEYGIFELVRIYKSFDWKKNVMIYYGY